MGVKAQKYDKVITGEDKYRKALEEIRIFFKDDDNYIALFASELLSRGVIPNHELINYARSQAQRTRPAGSAPRAYQTMSDFCKSFPKSEVQRARRKWRKLLTQSLNFDYALRMKYMVHAIKPKRRDGYIDGNKYTSYRYVFYFVVNEMMKKFKNLSSLTERIKSSQTT